MGNVHQLDLADQDRFGTRGRESPGDACGLGGKAEGCNNRRFLDCQGHHVILVIDQKVQPKTDREAHDTDDILDHGIGIADIEDGLAVDQRLVFL